MLLNNSMLRHQTPHKNIEPCPLNLCPLLFIIKLKRQEGAEVLKVQRFRVPPVCLILKFCKQNWGALDSGRGKQRTNWASKIRLWQFQASKLQGYRNARAVKQMAEPLSHQKGEEVTRKKLSPWLRLLLAAIVGAGSGGESVVHVWSKVL